MWYLEYEGILRLGSFVSLLMIFALWERAVPRRDWRAVRTKRWLTNLGLLFSGSLLLRIILPATAVTAALTAQHQGWGLLNWLDWPVALEIACAAIALDGLIYAQHVASHHWAWLWRLHKVHHSDPDIDVVTALRFHPGELVVSMLFKIACVTALGAPVAAVILFEVVLNGSAMFNHANARLPLALDALLRRVLVTPDMHRVHHSVLRSETQSNYGFCLAIWDRFFGTYIDQPVKGHTDMQIGLPNVASDHASAFTWTLKYPFMTDLSEDRE